jgi:hypothetical protein
MFDFRKTLDTAKFNRFHLKTIFVSGSGFLTDSYDLFIMYHNILI